MASKSGLGLLAGALAVGAGLFFMSSRSSAAPKPSPVPAPLEAELKQLYQQNPQLYASVTQALATATSPADLNRLQQAVQFSYPNLGAALAKRLSDTTLQISVFAPGQTPLVVSLDPQGHVHAYTKDFTEILVISAPPQLQVLSRNPSSSFDAIVQALAQPSLTTTGGSVAWKEIFDKLQAMTYGSPAPAPSV